MAKFAVLARNRTAVLAGLVAVVAVGAGVLALSSDDDGARSAQQGTEDSTTTSATGPEPRPSSSSPTSGPAPSTSTPSTGGGGTTSTSVIDDRPAASWTTDRVTRAKAPDGWLEAWDRARNKTTCGLLAPTAPLPGLEQATASWDELNDDEGWDVRLRQQDRIVEILGLFPRSAQGDTPRAAPFTRTWKDGSVARYGPDVPPEMSEGEMDPESTPYEARLIIPDQDCIYQIYDTLGQSHLEFVLGHLAFVEGTR